MSLLLATRSRAKGIVAKILIGLLVISMAAFGLDSFFDSQSGDNAPLTVNDQAVPQAEIENAVLNYKRQVTSQFGQEYVEQIPESIVVEGAVSNLVTGILNAQEAEHYGFTANDDRIEREIALASQFQSETGFDRDAFTNYLQVNNLTPQQFEDNVRQSLALRTLPRFMTKVGFAVDQEKDLIAGINYEVRDVGYSQLVYEDFIPLVTPTDDDYQTYYDEHLTSFQSKEKASFQYILLDRNDLLEDVAQPTEDVINLAYQNKVSELSQDLRYEISHILVNLDSRTDDEAKNRANEVVSLIDSGSEFNDLVAQYSDDLGSAKNNGSLGRLKLDEFLPEFIDQANLMSPGEIAGPIQSDFGYHVIRLDVDPKSTVPSLDELRDDLIDEIQSQEVSALFEKQKTALADATYSATDLATPARELDMALQTSALVSPSGSSYSEGDIFSNPQVLKEAFAQEVLVDKLNSQIIDLENKSIVVRLLEHQPASQLSIDDVREQVTDTVKQQQAKEEALEAAEKIIVHINDKQSNDLEQLLADTTFIDQLHAMLPQSVSLNWVIEKGMTRTNTDVDGEVLDVAFSLKGNPSMQQEERSGSIYMMALFRSEKPAYADLQEEEQNKMDQLLAQAQSTLYGEALYSYLRNKAVITDKRIGAESES